MKECIIVYRKTKQQLLLFPPRGNSVSYNIKYSILGWLAIFFILAAAGWILEFRKYHDGGGKFKNT